MSLSLNATLFVQAANPPEFCQLDYANAWLGICAVDQTVNQFIYFHQQSHLVLPNYRFCYALDQGCRYRKTNIWFGK